MDELCAQLIPSDEDEPGQRYEQRDVVILRSMPGLGRIILAVLLAEVWQPLRRRDYHALRSLSGVAPVTRRSGKTSVVVRRYACNKRLANALYHWARLATQHDALSRRYAALRQRGHSRGRALRTIALAGTLRPSFVRRNIYLDHRKGDRRCKGDRRRKGLQNRRKFRM